MTPHHIGCAVARLDQNSEIYSKALGLRRRSRTFEVVSQHVRVCFLELGQHFYLELIEPVGSAAKLERYLKTGFYHLCFLVDNLDSAADLLAENGFVGLPMFESEAFAGAPCQFFISPQSHLIELAQISAPDFEAFFDRNIATES